MADGQIERVNVDGAQDRYLVSLPCEPDLFGEFISKLLGKPQSISRKINGHFTIDRAGIENIYHIINQRVYEQNNSQLISFIANVHYSDGSSITINSYSDFRSYNEIRPLVVSGIALTWIYLITFNNTSAPEKQQIDVWFDTFLYDDDFPPEPEFDPSHLTKDRRYIRKARDISFKIQHTNRSWGGDIDNLLLGHLRGYLTPLRGWRALLTDFSPLIGLFVFLVMSIGSIYCAYQISETYNQQLRDKVKDAATSYGVGFSQVNERLDLINRMMLYQLDNAIGLGTFGFMVIALIISGVIGVVVGSSASYTNKSFILIGKSSVDRYENFKGSSDNNVSRFIMSIALALIIGVGGNILYYYLTKYTGFQQ